MVVLLLLLLAILWQRHQRKRERFIPEPRVDPIAPFPPPGHSIEAWSPSAQARGENPSGARALHLVSASPLMTENRHSPRKFSPVTPDVDGARRAWASTSEVLPSPTTGAATQAPIPAVVQMSVPSVRAMGTMIPLDLVDLIDQRVALRTQTTEADPPPSYMAS